MITTVDSQAWDASDLTGNSAVVVVGGATYLIGGRRGNSTQALYRSSDGGKTWAVVATIPAAPGAMDPSMVSDELGNLHILVAHPSTTKAGCTDLVKFTYATGAGTMSPGVILVKASMAQAAYDIASMGAGASLAVTAALEPEGRPGRYVLLAFEIAADQTFTTTAIVDQPWDRGDTFGGISLIAPGGSAPAELYVSRHPRAFTYRDTETAIARCTRTGPGTWEAFTQLTAFTSRFTDDKLTVVPTADGRRLIATAFHQQVRGVVRTSVHYGKGTYSAGAGTWSWAFSTLPATDAFAYREPVIGTDGSRDYLACLQATWGSAAGCFTRDGSLRIFTIDPTGTTLLPYPDPPATGAWEILRFKWLRGGKAPVAPTDHWMLVGLLGPGTDEASGGGAVYASEFNLPPVPSLVPATATIQRGEVLILDASATQDPDLDTLTYTWSHDHADVAHVHVTPIDNGRRAMVVVDKAIGPATTSFTVSVSVKDPLHAPVSASSTVTVPVNPAPVIHVDSFIEAQRNTPVDLAATVTDADVCTYLWEQLGGTPVTLLNARTLTPTVQAYRLDVAGEELVFRLTVSDGVNPPVTAQVDVLVAPMNPADLDVGKLARAVYRRVENLPQ